MSWTKNNDSVQLTCIQNRGLNQERPKIWNLVSNNYSVCSYLLNRWMIKIIHFKVLYDSVSFKYLILISLFSSDECLCKWYEKNLFPTKCVIHSYNPDTLEIEVWGQPVWGQPGLIARPNLKNKLTNKKE
jgi:hypothetical protein